MLHRSFKPAKCKTSLKLATSRLKLLKNKKEVSLKQMKRELAQLLESGQDRTARIRVEHVIREEKMMAAFDLIEIYCELIATRLSIIESQKTCPIDLKEAITSVIFATPRCADIPELKDIQKHFTAKYGKEFISAAIELRPQCGVSRMLIEKLSAKAPDIQTKIIVLSKIAEEHNITWEATSFQENELKPHDDLLNGPNIAENARKVPVDPPNLQPPSVATTLNRSQNHDVPSNFSDPSKKSSLGPEYISTTGTASSTTAPAAYHPDFRPSGTEAERMGHGQSHPEDRNYYSTDRQNWNMEFKDATAAAQAAAESAERASMAARAAAELSSGGKFSRQYSTESHHSHTSGYQVPDTYSSSKLPEKRLPKESMPSSFILRKKPNNEHQDMSDHDNLADVDDTKRSSQSASLRSSRSSIDDDTLQQKGNEYYSRKSSFQGEKGTERPFESEKFNYFEEPVRRQSSAVSPHSHLGSLGDSFNVSSSNYHKFGENSGEVPFVSVDESNNHRDDVQTSSHDAGAAVFDDYSSGDDELRFDMGTKYDEHDSRSYFHSSSIKSPFIVSENIGKTSIPVEKSTMPEFSERLAKSEDELDPDNHAHATFDDSEGQNSESEDEEEKSRHRMNNSRISGVQNSYRIDSEPIYNENQGWTGSSSAEKGKTTGYSSSKPRVESSADFENSPGTKLNVDSQRVKNQVEFVDSQRVKNQVDDGNQSSSESEKELSFGTLKGGLRNKGYRPPPFIRRVPSGNASSSSRNIPKQFDSSSTVSSTPERPENAKISNEPSSTMRIIESDSDTDNSHEQFQQQMSSRKVKYFDSDSDDEDAPKQGSLGRGHLGSGVSRRTKASASSSRPSNQALVIAEKTHTSTRSSYEKQHPVSRTLPESKSSSKNDKLSSSTVEKRKMVDSVRVEEAPKLSSSGGGGGSTNAATKASHTHPKLPDYETLAAHLQSLRSNR